MPTMCSGLPEVLKVDCPFRHNFVDEVKSLFTLMEGREIVKLDAFIVAAHLEFGPSVPYL